jgi:hypothetical protein
MMALDDAVSVAAWGYAIASASAICSLHLFMQTNINPS